MNIRRALVLPLAALLATTAAACGSDDSPSVQSSGSSPATVADTATDDTTDDTTGDTTGDTAPPATTPDTTAVPSTDATLPVDTTGEPNIPDSVPPGLVDSDFCRAADEAERIGDGVESAAAAGPAELEATVTAALAAAQASLALAPDDIAEVMARNVAVQERFVAILEQYNWNAQAALSSPEGIEFQAESAEVEADLDVVRTYLEENCGIRDDSDDRTVDLPEGEAGLRRFIQLYAIGAKAEVTPEQEDCFVKELTGEVEVEQLEAMLAGAEDNEAEIAVGIAALACDIIESD